MLKIAFWGLVALDVMGIGLFFLLGLAAAGSAKTNSLQVVLLLLVLPAIPLAASVLMFTRASAPFWRLLALLLAAAPLLVAISSRAIAELQYRVNSNTQGELTFFRAGPMREIAEAIARNDAAAVATLATKVDVNQTGLDGITLLVLAMRQLRKTPQQQDVLRALVAAGVDPNRDAQFEFPLSIAIQLGAVAGSDPVRVLLDAGAKPNVMTSFGEPLFFSATGTTAPIEVLSLLLERGADVNAVDSHGRTALFSAANTRNWKAALFLLQRGGDWRVGRSLDGLTFQQLVERDAGAADGDGTRGEVSRYLREH